MFRNKIVLWCFCFAWAMTVVGCVTKFEFLNLEQPVLHVPLSKGDHVLIYTKTDGVINMKVVDIDTASGTTWSSNTIYGWSVPDGKSPWMVKKSDRRGVVVDFAEIDGIKISQPDLRKMHPGVEAALSVLLLFPFLLGAFP